ncbi:MAG: hypothetical protein A2Z20_08820, partial [Bdellovibrionales bacterium RBG_16_40_8]
MVKLTTQTSEKNSLRLNNDDIDPNAFHIVKTLQRHGFTTYLVGGCVRDLLLNRHPKDFDIATFASPREVRRFINHSFIIGKRFRLVLVKRGETQYEVSTFRRDQGPADTQEELPDGDNLFGSPEEDARRRDFTINAFFYDPIKHELIDYAEGLPDLQHGVVRMIGDPDIRLLEDPIRILRGIRLAHMIRFSLDSKLREAMQRHAASLQGAALPRKREEILKFLRLDNPALPLLTSLDLGVLDYVSPQLAALLRDIPKVEVFLNYLFSFHDKKLNTPAELFAGLVVPYYLTLHGGQISPQLRAHDILNDEKLVRLMSNELGMFKSEQTLIAKAMHLMALFARKKEFANRGDRRRRA